ncbi:Egd1 protein [Saccharomycopsis crataegensis]|uniref:Nascent polypeptide-associated complex subunit beta n=1 Tax=Saccharomycopsis crataegensis TaxID=43959 RepID=A0AAV5QJR4_9ASCO|nr:Egd1 protein [Saccharomycopsis crataegensis]
MPIDPEKLAKLQKASANNKVGIGARRKAKKSTPAEDDTKVQAALKKLNPQTMDGVQEVNFFKDDGNVLHFNRASIQASAQNNTYAVYGRPQEKNLTELLPGILPQLGSENLDVLRQLAETIQKNGGLDAANAAQFAHDHEHDHDHDHEHKEEDIPELVAGESFEDQVE